MRKTGREFNERKWGRFYFRKKCIIFKNRSVPIFIVSAGG